MLSRALDKDPDRRWATGAELVDAADAALGDAGGRARHRIRLRAAAAGVAAWRWRWRA